MMEIKPVELDTPRPCVIVHALEGNGEWALGEIKAVADLHPGAYNVGLRVGRYTLTLGPKWRVEASPEAVARFEDFGRVEVLE
jgi:hypothetical protein